MRIAIDARVVGEKFGIESYFAKHLLGALVSVNMFEDDITVYVPENYHHAGKHKIKLIESDIKLGSLAEQVEFGKALKKEKYDLAHFLSINHPRSYHPRSIFTIHTAYDGPGRISQEYLNYHHALDSKERILITSEATQFWLRQSHKKKFTTLLLPGIDRRVAIDYENSADNVEMVSYLFCGCDGLEYDQRSVTDVIKTFASIYAKNRSCRLVLASTGKLIGHKDILAGHLSYLKNFVIVHENADEETYIKAQNRCDYVIVPWGSNHTSLSAQLALSYDCLILAANTFAMHSVLDQCAIYYNPGDSVDARDKLELLMDNEAVQDYLAREIRERAKKESWTTVATELIGMYRDKNN